MKNTTRIVGLSIGLAIVVFVSAALLLERTATAKFTPPQTSADSLGVNQPLEKVLNADGTLNLAAGFNGSLDARGWRMDYDTNGAPKFVKAATPLAPGDENWDQQFANSIGANGFVGALAVSGTDVYVGGYFVGIAGVQANNIAKWNGSSWSTLGSGVNSVVWALTASGSDLYVGGFFTTAGGASANYIAKWNGSV